MFKSCLAATAAVLLASPAALACDDCGCKGHKAGEKHDHGHAHSHHAVHDLHTSLKSDSKKAPDIVDAAASIKDFSTLVTAVKAAGLVDALKGDGPFTVFAPTNEAFERLPDETLASLLEPGNKEKLTSILLYHVVPGKVLAKDVVKVDAADTLLKGKRVDVRVKGENVYVDSARVTKTDVEVANGVIHIIDTVILPK